MADETVAFQGWNASGVGWGEDPWGESLASLPTGTGVVGAVAVAADANVSVTGVSASAFVNAVAVTAGANVAVTGVQAQALLGPVLVWAVIDDNQTPNWQNVDDSQAAGWSVISGSGQVPNWQGVDDSQTAGWAVVSDGNTVVWTQITT